MIEPNLGMETNLSRNLRRIREERNYSQQNVADELKVNQKTYSNYESNKTRISQNQLLKLSSFYNCSIEDFFSKNILFEILKPSNKPNEEIILERVEKEIAFLRQIILSQQETISRLDSHLSKLLDKIIEK